MKAKNNDRMRDAVLIHGLASSSILLRPMAMRLRRSGFRPHFWSYLSLRGSIEKHAANLLRFLHERKLTGADLVGHSMGSIICRRALLELVGEQTGRFVMLAPPNQGSHVASRLAPKLGWLCPALRELSDDPASYVRQLQVPRDVEIGIVQAEGDLVVRESSLPLADDIQTQTIAFPGMHSQLLLRPDVAESVAQFLSTGQFERSESLSPAIPNTAAH